ACSGTPFSRMSAARASASTTPFHARPPHATTSSAPRTANARAAASALRAKAALPVRHPSTHTTTRSFLARALDRRWQKPYCRGNPMRITFWGVRGSIPSPGPDTVGVGGNTSCVEVRAGKLLVVFDGGTGLRLLGKKLVKEMPFTAHLFFSHV